MRKTATGKRLCRKCHAAYKADTATAAPVKDPELKWYVLYVEIDADKRVVKDLKRQALIEGREKDIPNVIAATHKVTTYKDGKVKVTDELSFPGYVIVECRWSEQMHHFITSTRGVFGVLPLKPQLFGTRYGRKEPPKTRRPLAWEKDKAADWKPTALESEEAARLLISQSVGTVSKQSPADFTVGDKVVITDGTFKSMTGPILAITDGKVTVRVVMWGRDLDVEIQPWQARKA